MGLCGSVMLQMNDIGTDTDDELSENEFDKDHDDYIKKMITEISNNMDAESKHVDDIRIKKLYPGTDIGVHIATTESEQKKIQMYYDAMIRREAVCVAEISNIRQQNMHEN